MKRLIVAGICVLLPIVGFLATDGIIIAEMDQTIVKLMAAKIAVVGAAVVYAITSEVTSK